MFSRFDIYTYIDTYIRVQVIFEPSAGYEPRAELHVCRLNEHYISTSLGEGLPLFSNCDEEVALDALVQKAEALGLATNAQAKG
jgi:hypothetical protein